MENFDLLSNPFGKLTVAGLKNSQHGSVFQLGLLTLSALRAKRSAKKFYLIAEAKEFEKFDDLVIDYGDSITLVQAKHSEKNEYYSKSDFLKKYLGKKGKSTDASLAKYFDSWSIIRQLPCLKLPNGETKKTKFIFFSNKKLKKEMNNYIEEIHIENDEFAFSYPFTTPSYRIISGKKRHNFIEAIKTHSKTFKQENSDVENQDIFNSSEKNQTEIEQFLDQFIIKIAQPNVDQLLEIVRQEISDQVNIGVQETYTGVMQFMLEWFKDMKTCVLKSEQFINWNYLQDADLFRFFFMHYTKAFEEEFSDSLLDFKGFVNKKILDFLKDAKSEQNVQTVIGINARPIVYVTIKELINLKQDEWIYIDYNDKIVRDIEAVFPSGIIKFIVINCQNIGFDKQQTLNIGNLLKNNGSIKIIILTKATLDISKYLIKEKSQEVLLELPSDEQINVLYNKHENKFITLAGKEYKIKDIIGQRLGSIYEIMKNFQYFSQITQHAHENQVFVESGMPYGIYIENEMIYGEGYYDLSIILRKTTPLYIITGVDYINLLKKLKTLFHENEENFAEIENTESDFERWKKSDFILLKHPNQFYSFNAAVNNFSKICILTDKPSVFNDKCFHEKCYLLLNYVSSSSTERFKVVENPSNVYLPFAEGIDYSNRGLQKNFFKDISTGNLVSILLAPAGYGKTSFCKNIIDEHKKSENISRPIWIVNIPLPLLQFDNQGQPNLDPFLNIHHSWQNEAFQADKHKKGMILLILDSFDEVKDVKVVNLINNFFQKEISELKISCLITTRPYASNKLLLPSERLAIYKLTKYTKKQQEEYIRKYITAILKKFEPSEKALNGFVKKVRRTTTKLNKNSSKILGIPLESFLFCELLQPHILDYIVKNDNKVPEKCRTNFKHLDISNTANLYQEFIRSKSILFLEKHIGVKSENLYDKSMTFNLMGTYNHIMELHALKQSFSIKEDMSKYTKTINFEIRAFKTLEDTGLLKVSEDKDGTKLNFNHETYQEFYSALAIIRGFLSEKGYLFDLVKKLVAQNCYDPKYHFIFSIISQFSFVGGPMIPGYNKDLNLLEYWEALGENSDVIGAGAVRVFNYCLSEFITEKDKRNKTLEKYFFSKIGRKQWIKYIDYVLSVKNLSQNPSNKNKDEEDEDELPIINYTDDSVEQKDNNQIYSSIAQRFRFLNKSNRLCKDDVVLLEKETEKHKEKYDYWAINVGIEAVGYTGKLFSKPLADFLIKRAEFWNNNRKAAVLALREIYKSLTDEDIIAKMNCFYVLKTIALSADEDNAMQSLLHQVNQDFIHYLIMDLSSDWPFLIIENYMNENPLIKYNRLQSIKSLFFVAEKLQYAVTVRDKHVFLVKEKEIKINFGNGNLNESFTKEVFNYIRIISSFEKYTPNSWSNLFVLEDAEQSMVRFKQKIENLNLNDDKEFDSLLHEQGQYKTYTSTLYAHLFVNRLLNKHHVEGLVQLWQNSDNLPSKFWEEDAGIITIGYTGHYFNMQLATFLCNVKYWRDNIDKARAALNQIFNTLTIDNIEDRNNYHNAVQAYNYCAEKDLFNGFKTIQKLRNRKRKSKDGRKDELDGRMDN